MTQVTEIKNNPNIDLIAQIAEKNSKLLRMLATNGKDKAERK